MNKNKAVYQVSEKGWVKMKKKIKNGFRRWKHIFIDGFRLIQKKIEKSKHSEEEVYAKSEAFVIPSQSMWSVILIRVTKKVSLFRLAIWSLIVCRVGTKVHRMNGEWITLK